MKKMMDKMQENHAKEMKEINSKLKEALNRPPVVR